MKASIIIRTRNEESWIASCLRAVFAQTYGDFEVILVDNQSADRTVDRAGEFDVRILTIADFLPGRALNHGIAAASGDIVVCLSAHCVPTNSEWLGHLVRNLADRKVAGVYGRQIPMAFSSDRDKRDLLTVFGRERRVQRRDSFFHNANSAIRREVWRKIPFDDQVTNIEDRIWGGQVIAQGYTIVYEPEACVYHHHGIHQDSDPDRCRSVVRVLESLESARGENGQRVSFDLSGLSTIALVPIKGPVQHCGDRPLIAYTLEEALSARHLRRVVVSTDNEEMAELARSAGAEVPFMRPPELSRELVDIRAVLQYSLDQLDRLGWPVDLVAVLQATYPFRPPGLIDRLIEKLVREGLDAVMPVMTEGRAAWIKEGTKISMCSGLMPRSLKEERIHIGLFGLAFVSRAGVVRSGELPGRNVGIYEVQDRHAQIELRTPTDLARAGAMIGEYWRTREAAAPVAVVGHGKG